LLYLSQLVHYLVCKFAIIDHHRDISSIINHITS